MVILEEPRIAWHRLLCSDLTEWSWTYQIRDTKIYEETQGYNYKEIYQDNYIEKMEIVKEEWDDNTLAFI